MKKKSGWIAFGIDSGGDIYLDGCDMCPAIYKTKRKASKNTRPNSRQPKIKPPHPVKIEWMVEK